MIGGLALRFHKSAWEPLRGGVHVRDGQTRKILLPHAHVHLYLFNILGFHVRYCLAGAGGQGFCCLNTHTRIHTHTESTEGSSRIEKFKMYSPNLTMQMREVLIDQLGNLVIELSCS